MNNIVGQERLLSELSLIDPFPQVVLLSGEYGSGKHLISNYISNNILHQDMVDVTNLLDSDFIVNAYTETIHKVYLCNLDVYTEQKQNTILKFIEEPPINCNIILLSSNLCSVLPTIRSRAYKFYVDTYSANTLESFIDKSSECFDEKYNKVIVEICKTPGQVKELNYCIIPEMDRICSAIISSIKKATLPNTLTISDKMNYDNDYDKFDIRAFLNLLTQKIHTSYIETENDELITWYALTQKYINMLSINGVNKRFIMDNYLIELWRLSRCI